MLVNVASEIEFVTNETGCRGGLFMWRVWINLGENLDHYLRVNSWFIFYVSFVPVRTVCIEQSKRCLVITSGHYSSIGYRTLVFFINHNLYRHCFIELHKYVTVFFAYCVIHKHTSAWDILRHIGYTQYIQTTHIA